MALGAVFQLGAQTALEPVKTSITVVEKLTTEAPANLTIESKQEIEQVPGVNLDDRLRMVPGFSLFRRSSSVVANPTTQGVSLRGIGPSGASRTLVRWDGVPVNDPFGGWVQWTRFSPEDLDRVEISRGASTSVFGDRAMGGAVSLFSRPLDSKRLHAAYEGGNRNTHQLAGGFVGIWKHVAASAQARGFTTNGYYVVPENVRGRVDSEAAVDFAAGDARLDFFGARQRLFLKFDVLAEQRRNGTQAQKNSTSLGSLSGQYFREGVHDGLSLLGYHVREEFRASFSTIAPDRNSERLTILQTVPAEATGGAATWRHSATSWHSVVGADVHHVEGFSRDTTVATGTLRVTGGTQLLHGYFGQFNPTLGPVNLFLGARYQSADRDQRFFSPSAGAAAAKGPFRFRGSVYRSFRAPTLNELYREFRAGNVITQANEMLERELLFGVEAGVDWTAENTRLGVTAYHHALDDLITNVTLSSTPNLIVRQRQNAGEARARGVEIEGSQRWRKWMAEAAYLFVDSSFQDVLLVPQVPRHQGSAQLTYSRGGTLIAGGLRAYSSQFEDDANQFLLPGFAVLHLTVRQRIRPSLWLLAAIENLAGREFLVGYTPTPQTGAPRLWRLGLRWDSRP